MPGFFDAVIALAAFGSTISIAALRYRYKAIEKGFLGPKQLEASPEEKKQLDELKEAKKQLEARVQNLESIVCSVDLELNARLGKLAAEQSRLGLSAGHVAGQLPAGGGPASAPRGAQPNEGNDFGNAPTQHPAPRAPGGFSSGQVVAGRYTIERELGRGGMGAVYLARDAQLGELVALKVISVPTFHDPGAATERFRREASAARKVTHPNVVRIHDIGEADGLLFLSMEYVDGMTLGGFVARRGALPIEESRHFMSQILDGLSAAHRAGVIHRDLKPQNILINASRNAKIIDFGLAKSAFLDGMTATGMIMGTPEYMSPEQLRGRPVDMRTDIYSFGCLAYYMFTGVPPFRGESPIAVGFMHCNQAPVQPKHLRPELPQPIETAILQCLNKEPSNRFESVEEVKRAMLA